MKASWATSSMSAGSRIMRDSSRMILRWYLITSRSKACRSPRLTRSTSARSTSRSLMPPSRREAGPQARPIARSEAPHQHRAVGAAETEGIGQRHVDLQVARLVGAVVQVAFGILVEEIDGRRRNLVVYRQGREDRLDTARRAQQMPRHGLGGVHHQFIGMVAECELERRRLVLVAQRGGRAVGVDVADLVGIHAAVAQRVQYPPARAVLVRAGDVVRVGAHAEAE